MKATSTEHGCVNDQKWEAMRSTAGGTSSPTMQG
jgi:hypothetical protein